LAWHIKIDIDKSCSRSRQAELGEVEGFRWTLRSCCRSSLQQTENQTI